jgi:gliding motility-associated-like protein
MIFNRWGNKVYEASPYLNDWDGTSMFGLTVGGNQLPVGTYFYIIEPGNGEKAIKGYIYLNK